MIRDVTAAVFIKDGRVMICRRPPNKGNALKWEFPGGKIEAGETAEQALHREIKEELDAEITVGELISTVEWDYPDFHLTLHCFWCGVSGDTLHLNEHEAAAWLTADTLFSVKWLPADQDILKVIAQCLERN